MDCSTDGLDLIDHDPTEFFAQEVIEGLTQPQKVLPCKYLYDEHGSILFDKICNLQEYYPTRTEVGIMQQYAEEIVAELGARCLLIEFGSGSSLKTRTLLEHMHEPAGYVPIDISREHLLKSAQSLSESYPEVEILPVCADFHEEFEVPAPRKSAKRRVVYNPGSTIGNCTPAEAVVMLHDIARICGDGGGLLIGVDLKKDVAILEQAYNDPAGVTAEFNLNILTRINRELDADFQVDAFEHKAIYNDDLSRVEMHLMSKEDQTVAVHDEEIPFAAGETIHTENSHKYDRDDFVALAAKAGWTSQHVWIDSDRLFSVHYLTFGS